MLVCQCAGISVEQFVQDKEYKRETILQLARYGESVWIINFIFNKSLCKWIGARDVLGLARNGDENVYGTAVLLANRHNISLWDVYFSHLDWMLTDSG